MALFTTDWKNELKQVNESLTTLLHDELEPMVNRSLDRGIEEADKTVNKASSEIQAAIAQLSNEVDRQRILLMRNIWKVTVGFILMATLSGAFLIFLFKTL